LGAFFRCDADYIIILLILVILDINFELSEGGSREEGNDI
jgi:hypothetical protein